MRKEVRKLNKTGSRLTAQTLKMPAIPDDVFLS